jgi:hypothetical protein
MWGFLEDAVVERDRGLERAAGLLAAGLQFSVRTDIEWETGLPEGRAWGHPSAAEPFAAECRGERAPAPASSCGRAAGFAPPFLLLPCDGERQRLRPVGSPALPMQACRPAAALGNRPQPDCVFYL